MLSELWAEAFAGTRVVVNAMHPGWAETPGVERSLPGFFRLTRSILRTPAEGADSVVWLAASEAARELTGQFVFDRKPRRTVLLPGTGETRAERGRFVSLCDAAIAPAR